jgi:hypothetical protein
MSDVTHEKPMLPSSVRYVKNGEKGRWWNAAQKNAQVHLGWRSISHGLLINRPSAHIGRKGPGCRLFCEDSG